MIGQDGVDRRPLRRFQIQMLTHGIQVLLDDDVGRFLRTVTIRRRRAGRTATIVRAIRDPHVEQTRVEAEGQRKQQEQESLHHSPDLSVA